MTECMDCERETFERCPRCDQVSLADELDAIGPLQGICDGCRGEIKEGPEWQ